MNLKINKLLTLLNSIIYLSATTIIPTLHILGIIDPHSHNTACTTCQQSKFSEHPHRQHTGITISEKSSSSHGHHKQTCSICHFVKHFAGIKYFSAEIKALLIRYPSHFSSLISTVIFQYKFSIFHSRAPPASLIF